MKLNKFLSNSNLTFKEKKIVGVTKGIISGTNVDNHGHKMSLNDLQNMKIAFEKRPWMIIDHNPSKCPIGRIKLLEIQEKEEEFYLYQETDVVDEDALNKMIDGRLTGFSVEFVSK
jgi:hypothetical protein